MRRWVAVAALLVGAAVLVPAASPSAQVPEGDATRGEELYQANCAMCHGADATGMRGMHPALTGVVERLTVEGVEVAIRQGRDTRPPMPAFGDQLDEADLADLIAYLDTLPPGPRTFGPELMPGPMDDAGMGGMMGDMMTGATAMLWVVVVVLAAALAGVIGYLIGQRRR